MGFDMKSSGVLIVGRSKDKTLKGIALSLGLTPWVRQRMREALDDLRHRRFSAVLVDRDNEDVDVLEFILNVRDLDDRVPVFVIAQSQPEGPDKALLSLRRVFLLGRSEVHDKLAEEIEKVSRQDRREPE